jgi:hypothetical protein
VIGITLAKNRTVSDAHSIISQERASVPSQKTIPIEHLRVALVRAQEVREPQSFISACEACSPDATLPFDYLLDELLGCDPSSTEYLMYRTAVCPSCNHAITEKTLVVVS